MMLAKMLKNKNFLMDVIVIILGCFISSLGVNMFLTHAKLLSGGATGIGLMFEYLLGIPSGIVVFLVNLPLFFLSYKKLSRRFTIYSAIGMASLSISLIITKPFASLIDVNDILLYCIYGGVLLGLGGGLVFLRSGSTGGTDIVTMLIRKKYSNFPIGKLSFSINLIIILIGAFFFGVPKSLYTLISIFIQGMVADIVLRGFTSKKLFLILTNKEQEIIDFIIKDMNRGVTSLIAEGEYTHKQKKMLYCAVTTKQMIYFKRKILCIDPSAFITMIDISEIKGKGFIEI